jgi:hypothetical protein
VPLDANNRLRKPTEMELRIAKALDPEAWILAAAMDNLFCDEDLVLLAIARQEAAYMKARTIIALMREPTEHMKRNGMVRWRELVDMLLSEQNAT